MAECSGQGTWKLPTNADVKKAPRRIACVELSRVEVNLPTARSVRKFGPWIQHPPALVALPPPLVFSNYITMSEVRTASTKQITNRQHADTALDWTVDSTSTSSTWS